MKLADIVIGQEYAAWTGTKHRYNVERVRADRIDRPHPHLPREVYVTLMDSSGAVLRWQQDVTRFGEPQHKAGDPKTAVKMPREIQMLWTDYLADEEKRRLARIAYDDRDNEQEARNRARIEALGIHGAGYTRSSLRQTGNPALSIQLNDLEAWVKAVKEQS